MASLARELRKDLGNKVTAARRMAEEGAHKVVESLAVHNSAPWDSMSAADRKLRNRLRAHGRQLGDQRDQKGAQSIDRLVSEVAYEHWHGMLFARFLAENDLLLMPGTTTAISLEEVEEIAREEKRDWLAVVSGYAEAMLPQIFRSDDPALEVVLPRETRNELEQIVRGFDRDVFIASDSLGWVYQFWQADRKEEVNASGRKIGADELPAVTQLFTEDYMVDFLLDNTLGAWHAGKVLAVNPSLAKSAESEEELRNAVALPGCPWTFLRFVRNEGRWIPAAGTFESWPQTARELRCIDPCMGSGHFIVAMFERLVALLIAEGAEDEASAVTAVIGETLFGLEIDPRCTQIAAFNLALAAWKRIGHSVLPAMNLACSGIAPNVKREEWLKIAGDSDRLQRGMDRIYTVFNDAPLLGSLIGPRAAGGDLIEADFHELRPLLEKAFEQEAKDEVAQEMAVTARGLAKAAEILAGQFTLVATNVPYLGRGKQDPVLMDYCERAHPDAKADLATCFVERCIEFCAGGASACLVTPQNWLFLGGYQEFRERLLKEAQWDVVARLGENGFDSAQAAGAFTALVCLSKKQCLDGHSFVGIDVAEENGPVRKAALLGSGDALALDQAAQFENPDSRIMFVVSGPVKAQLGEYADSYQGAVTGDLQRFVGAFWEFSSWRTWEPFRTAINSPTNDNGSTYAIRWENGVGQLAEYARLTRDQLHDMHESGQRAWGKHGIAINRMRGLNSTVSRGEKFDNNVAVLVPSAPEYFLPILAFCTSEKFHTAVRALDQTLKVTNQTLRKVPFDLAHWQKIADKKYPLGAPMPSCSDATQWSFDGNPKGSNQPLHVAVVRLLGFRWPRQTGAVLPDCPVLGSDGLESLADDDGIVCLSSARGEAPADERLRELLGKVWGKEWNAAVLEGLLAQVGYGGKTLDDWLRNAFFEQHCATFNARPFIWHVWDGRRDGFNALVNYHRLVGVGGEGGRTLDKLIYTYLGAWIERQQVDQKAGIDGADGRLAAAQHLKGELEKIRKGEPPFDIFVRWKSITKQPIGWNPDIDDGIRVNIRPFMTARPLVAKAKNACILRNVPKVGWEKDRGKDPERSKEDFPWLWKWDGATEEFLGGSDFDGVRWNDLHYSLATKQKAASTKDAA